MSFDNDSGLRAIYTFNKWKEAYPAMPAVVAVIKQFLLLRGLNEVPTGGLGGFSIICLVVSLFQHMPHSVDGQGPTLGSVLMDFFDFYGNKFDFTSVGIRLNPPGYFNKAVYSHDRKPRLSIEDPNKPDNDISVGTKEIDLILRSFSKAYDALKSRMKSLATSQNPDVCFLDTIISACYDEYAEQRAQLRSLFERETRFEPYLRLLTPPPPPPDSPSESEYDPEEDAPAPPPPPPPPAELKSETSTTSKSSKSSKSGKEKGPSKRQKKEGKKQDRKERKRVAAQDRTKRLKLLLPDRAAAVKDEIGHEEAFLFSGYEKRSKFWSDMAQVPKKPVGA
jgi:non-canonical poly(A) RNA polymerase PAPD5/7